MKDLTNVELLAELDKTKKELEKYKEAIASAETKLQTKADSMMDNHDEKMKNMMQYMDARIGYVYDMIANMRNMLYQHQDQMYSYVRNHSNGHMPALSASQMKKALDSCGAGEDYNIVKPYLSVASSKTSRGVEITASFKKDGKA